MESRLDLCAANKRTGYCNKCGCYVSTDPITKEKDCREFSVDLDSIDEEGNWDADNELYYPEYHGD